jgi:hypothetical protein
MIFLGFMLGLLFCVLAMSLWYWLDERREKREIEQSTPEQIDELMVQEYLSLFVEKDRKNLCRQRALEKFKQQYGRDPQL